MAGGVVALVCLVSFVAGGVVTLVGLFPFVTGGVVKGLEFSVYWLGLFNSDFEEVLIKTT